MDNGHNICTFCRHNLDRKIEVLNPDGTPIWEPTKQYKELHCFLGYTQNPKTAKGVANALKNRGEVCEYLRVLIPRKERR